MKASGHLHPTSKGKTMTWALAIENYGEPHDETVRIPTHAKPTNTCGSDDIMKHNRQSIKVKIRPSSNALRRTDGIKQ